MEREKLLVITLINFAWKQSYREEISLHERLASFKSEVDEIMKNSLPINYHPVLDLWEYKT